MKNISARTWVLMGFGLSLFSVVVNIFVIAGINDRIKEIDGELSKLNESLRTQAEEVSRAEIKNDLFMVLNHLSKLSKGEEKQLAGSDSIILMQDFLKRYHVAVNDIPMNEMLRTESEQLTNAMPAIEKIKQAIEQAKAGNQAEAEKLMAEAEKMHVNSESNSELGKKFQEIDKLTEAEGVDEMNTTEVSFTIVPYLKSLLEQYMAENQRKQERIKELQNKRANLSWWVSIATYAAVSLQLFGLMFVLSKDLASDAKSRGEKIEEVAQTPKEATGRSQTTVGSNNSPDESSKSVSKSSKESENMLAELKEEARLAIDGADKNKGEPRL